MIFLGAFQIVAGAQILFDMSLP